MHTNAEKCRRYRQKLKLRCAAIFGWQCQMCASAVATQYAHKEPTTVAGYGRGMTRRCIDILRNPTKYIRVCGPCHRNMNTEDKHVPLTAA
jgi:hypothetical protein